MAEPPETAGLSAEDLRLEITVQDYETFTFGDDSVAVRCIEKAKIWVRGKVLSTGHAYDESNVVIRECTLKRAVYELFVFNSLEDRAKEKNRDCADLIESYFGSIATKDNGNEGADTGPAIAVVRPPEGEYRYGR